MPPGHRTNLHEPIKAIAVEAIQKLRDSGKDVYEFPIET